MWKGGEVSPRRNQVAGFLGAVLVVWYAAMPVASAAVELKRVTPEKAPSLIEISGGAGRQAWKIRYGTVAAYTDWARLTEAPGKRAWFSHGGWLRLIDTEKGLVSGRWHFPGLIVRLLPVDGRVEVEFEDKSGDQTFRRTLTLDPGARAIIPYWQPGSLLLNGIPNSEVESIYRLGTDLGLLSEQGKIPAEQAKRFIPELEEAVGRDPASPWLRIALARSLRDAQDPRAARVFEEALQVPTTDFTELLRISAFLERLGERDAAGRAFERGYGDFLARGNDPRLFFTLLGKFFLYSPWRSGQMDPASDHGRELMERSYQLTPNCEAADFAWEMYAGILEKRGRAEEARLWRTRAAEASETSVTMLPRKMLLMGDRGVLLALASLLAAVLYFILLGVRYFPQRRADSAAWKGKSWPGRAFSWLTLHYWTRGQRIAFLTIVLLAWLSVGAVGGILQAVLRVAAWPLSSGVGSFAGPAIESFLKKGLPASSERDLLLALAQQQSGENEAAERLYRRLPQFAESWNNLGVILKEAGKEPEARQAFERALRLDMGLAEAALNLGRPPQDYWTELHRKYVSNRLMIAPPRAGRLTRAVLGGSRGLILLRAVAGPFEVAVAPTAMGEPGRLDTSPAALTMDAVFILGLVFAVALFFLSAWPVTRPPRRIDTVLEIIFPGVCPRWSLVGGLALAAWCYFALADALLVWKGTPYIFASIALPNLTRSYGLLGDIDFLGLINPSWVWVYLAPAVLFAVNLLLVFRDKLFHKQL